MTKIKTVHTESDAMEFLHDLSMSDDIRHAAAGRLLKKILPIMVAWIDDEIERKTSRVDLITAMTGVVTCVGSSIVGTVCNGDQAVMADTLDVFAFDVHQGFARIINDMRGGVR